MATKYAERRVVARAGPEDIIGRVYPTARAAAAAGATQAVPIDRIPAADLAPAIRRATNRGWGLSAPWDEPDYYRAESRDGYAVVALACDHGPDERCCERVALRVYRP